MARTDTDQWGILIYNKPQKLSDWFIGDVGGWMPRMAPNLVGLPICLLHDTGQTHYDRDHSVFCWYDLWWFNSWHWVEIKCIGIKKKDKNCVIFEGNFWRWSFMGWLHNDPDTSTAQAIWSAGLFLPYFTRL